jgi:hypothetical protein
MDHLWGGIIPENHLAAVRSTALVLDDERYRGAAHTPLNNFSQFSIGQALARKAVGAHWMIFAGEASAAAVWAPA